MPAQRETALGPEAQAIIHQDFGAFSKLVESGWQNPRSPSYRAAREGGYDYGMGHDGIQYRPFMRLTDALSMPGDGLVWFREKGNTHERKIPYANPEDYIGIRDNYDAFKTFIEKRLDAGKVDTSFGGMGGEDCETNPAVYVHFLHQGSSHEPFRANVERAVVELTRDELDRDLSNFDPQEARRRVTRNFEYHHPQGIEEYFSWLDGFLHGGKLEDRIDYLKIAKADPNLRDRVIRELAATQRVTTEVEHAEKIEHSTVEHARKYDWYENARKSGKLGKITHFAELSSETKDLLREDLMVRETEAFLSDRSTKKYNRIVTLLETVISIGTPEGPLAELYPQIKEAVETGRYHDVPYVKIGGFQVNIENHLLMALAVLQPGTELRGFWQDRIAKDPDKFRVLTALEGLLRMGGDASERQAEIPGILAAFSSRGEALDMATGKMEDSLFDRNGLSHYIVQQLKSSTYASYPFMHLESGASYMDVLTDQRVAKGKYTYRFDRYTKDGATSGEIIYDATTNSFLGDEQFADSVRATIDDDRHALRVGKNVDMETLIGRIITSPEDAKLIEGLGPEAVGSLEGVMRLNRYDFAFLFDPKTQKLLLSRSHVKIPADWGNRTWNGRKPRINETKTKTPTSDLVDLDTLGEEVDRRARKKEDEGTVYDAEIYLKGKVTAKLKKPIVAILTGRLVNTDQDLVD
jgi:hypothetical protein